MEGVSGLISAVRHDVFLDVTTFEDDVFVGVAASDAAFYGDELTAAAAMRRRRRWSGKRQRVRMIVNVIMRGRRSDKGCGRQVGGRRMKTKWDTEGGQPSRWKGREEKKRE